jgi:hypothetical protein
MGIRGIVQDERGHVIPNAEIFVEEVRQSPKYIYQFQTYWNGTTALNPLSVLSNENGNFNKIFWPEKATTKVLLHVTVKTFLSTTPVTYLAR